MMTRRYVREMCTTPIRLFGILGYNDRMNDIIYCPPTIQSNATTIFFGGDVQNFKENMETHEANSKYIQWNLENTATLLNESFPNSHIVVIRPSRMEHETFSCFKNFVPSVKYGVPDYVPTHQSIHHLNALLHNLSEKLALEKLEDPTTVPMVDSAVKCPPPMDKDQSYYDIARTCSDLNLNTIRLIGFSKGCVVLNQLLHEFHHYKTQAPNDEVAENLINKIKEMYWLDGGHSGVKNTWITSPDILKCYASLREYRLKFQESIEIYYSVQGIKTYVHVTPYQVEDPKRPWITQEESDFYNILCKLGVDVHRQLHFSNTTPSLDAHFNVLNILRDVK